jgi:hypothetical protein
VDSAPAPRREIIRGTGVIAQLRSIAALQHRKIDWRRNKSIPK